ncbi:MAG: hypothetical protein AB8B55_09825 [Mariniblastus sp.]
MNRSIFQHSIIVCVGLAVFFAGAVPGQAQVKYSPDHPDVKAMADSAVAHLETRRLLDRFLVLAGLAITEHSRRYNESVPVGNAVVDRAINYVVDNVPLDGESVSEERNILLDDECYLPALSLILLAETDAQKYKPQIKALLKSFEDRQRPWGAFTYRRQPESGDTSQTQFAALAMFVAKQNGFYVNPEMAKKTLNWLCDSQQGQAWVYKLVGAGALKPDGTSGPSLSMQCAGLSSVYLLADVLQLNKRVKSMDKSLVKDNGLPRTVNIWTPPIDGDNKNAKKTGPLVSFDRGKLGGSTRGGNDWLINNFRVDGSPWNYYYLYALERYGYFREQAEGDVRGLDDWYDQTIEYFKGKQLSNGGFSGASPEDDTTAVSMAILFMVRSSQLLRSGSTSTTLKGGLGFKKDTVLSQGKKGDIRSRETERSLDDLLEMMKGKPTAEELQELSDSLKKQVIAFRQKDDKSRGEIKAFLRSMIGAKSYFRRLIAVRFLAGEQDMDNVPALIYALGDPDYRICIEAHDGLRLISRKIDSVALSESAIKNARRDPGVLKKEPELEAALRSEFNGIKKKWTSWFLKIRPGAELLEKTGE